jgi:hypothetical protein
MIMPVRLPCPRYRPIHNPHDLLPPPSPSTATRATPRARTHTHTQFTLRPFSLSCWHRCSVFRGIFSSCRS